MLGYHNPFNADPKSPIGMIADPAIKALSAVTSAEAAAFGAKYVDTYTPFLGHELAYTYIAAGNVHPNATGYAVIGAQIGARPRARHDLGGRSELRRPAAPPPQDRVNMVFRGVRRPAEPTSCPAGASHPSKTLASRDIAVGR